MHLHWTGISFVFRDIAFLIIIKFLFMLFLVGVLTRLLARQPRNRGSFPSRSKTLFDSSVSIASWYGLADWGMGFQFPPGSRDLSLLYSVQTSSWADTSPSWGTMWNIFYFWFLVVKRLIVILQSQMTKGPVVNSQYAAFRGPKFVGSVVRELLMYISYPL
jgi:hypothetical protein